MTNETLQQILRDLGASVYNGEARGSEATIAKIVQKFKHNHFASHVLTRTEPRRVTFAQKPA